MRSKDVAHMMENALPFGCSSDGILFHRPKGGKWLNKVFQKHINNLESDLLDSGQFIFGPPPRPPFFPVRSVEDKLGGRNDTRDSSARSRSWQLGLTSLEKRHEALFDPTEFGGVFCCSGREGQRKRIHWMDSGGPEQGQIAREDKRS